VKKLLVKECGGGGGKGSKTVIACVAMADPLEYKDVPGGFAAPLGDTSASAAKGGRELSAEQALNNDKEKEIFEGVELMRRVMDNLLDWWNHLLQIRHGAPYNDGTDNAQLDGLADTPQHGDDCTALQLDTHVGLDVLNRAASEFDTLIGGAVAQLREIKKKEKGTKNVRFVLAMFVDACRLRREKIRNTMSARQLAEHKRAAAVSAILLKDLHNQDQIGKLRSANKHLVAMLEQVRSQSVFNICTQSLQESLAECIETKLQLHETQLEFLKARSGGVADAAGPALMVLKERWTALKKFSIYSLYQEFQQRPMGRQSFSSDEELLTYLAHSSDTKIDQIINADRDKIISRDGLVPQLCYDILLENAELRKMCNTYQLKVLMFRQKGSGSSVR